MKSLGKEIKAEEISEWRTEDAQWILRIKDSQGSTKWIMLHGSGDASNAAWLVELLTKGSVACHAFLIPAGGSLPLL